MDESGIVSNENQLDPKRKVTFNNKILLLYGGICIILLLLFIVYLFHLYSATNLNHQGKHFSSALITPTSFQTPPLTVLSTNPSDKEQNVATGEIQIQITTSTPVLYQRQFTFSITPSVADYLIKNSFPSKTLVIQLVGGLKQNTTYTAKISIKQGQSYAWSFSTNAKAPSNSSLEFAQFEQNSVVESYPLYALFPYTTNDYTLGYYGPKEIEVKITNPDQNKVKQEVNAWIQSKGVDPATQTFTYFDSNWNVISTQSATVVYTPTPVQGQ